jgi:hypothetical protein
MLVSGMVVVGNPDWLISAARFGMSTATDDGQWTRERGVHEDLATTKRLHQRTSITLPSWNSTVVMFLYL